MASLFSLSLADGLDLPATHGGVTLAEAPPSPITWIAPFRGRAGDVASALEAATGCGWPAPNRFTEADGTRAVWAGPGQALVIGRALAPEGAAVADQSDGWCHLVLDGAEVRDVLARLVPADLRDGAFAVGHAARTLLFHMTATLMRTGPDRYECLVFRSMAGTAVDDLTGAMRRVAARRAL